MVALRPSQAFLFLVLCVGILPLPIKPKRGHFFVFWKTTSLRILPKLHHLQGRTHRLIREYFDAELVNRTSNGERSKHTMESAKDLYRRLNLTQFPSQRVLDRDNKTPFIFIKGLLKENYRLSDGFSKILLEEKRFRCKIDDAISRSLCDRTKELQKGLREVTEAIKEQLVGYFLTGKVSAAKVSRRQRKIIAYFNKKQQTDENNAKSTNTDDSYDSAKDNVADDYADYPTIHSDKLVDKDSSVTVRYKRRNRASVGVLYAVYVHLKDIEGTLKYALAQLQPNRE